MKRLPRVGDQVRIERDETVYPSRGTWPQYRGRTATLVSVTRAKTVKVRDGQTVRVTAEYGVSFGRSTSTDAWFKQYELTVSSVHSNDDMVISDDSYRTKKGE